MAQLMQWEKEIPHDFYSTKSHMWILDPETKKVRMSKKQLIHASIWGEWVWNQPLRGYYNDNYGLVMCHGFVDDELMRKLSKKFPRAMFIYKGW
jgi:hypothetical protein